MTVAAATERALPLHDRPNFRELCGRRPALSLDKIFRAVVKVNAAQERKARIHYRELAAPSELATEEPSVDDPLLAGLIRIRASKPRWEAAWHLRGDVRVAPAYPLVLAEGRFVAGSAGFYQDLLPSTVMREYRRCYFGGPTLRIERAILLRDFWDGNFWHLLNDLMPRLAMAEALGLETDLPLVVSEILMTRYGDHLKATSLLSKRQLIVQPAEHTLCCRELYLLRPGEFASHWAPNTIDSIQSMPSAEVGARYLYCRREPQTSQGRTAENALEIEEIFRAAGFAVVDPASMPIGQQKGLFEQAEIVAGINGAAFANALFRHGRPLTIGAFISSNWRSTTIPTMAKVFGFRYVGHTVRPGGEGFWDSMMVPPDTARRLIDQVLGQVPQHAEPTN